MPDTKITALAAITTVAPANDLFAIVDVSDNSMAASGTTKNITTNQILGAGGTATLASATITGDLTVDTSTLKVDSANNRVGIGTASPATILDIQSAGGVFARIQNTTSTADAYLLVKNTTGEGFFGINALGPYIYTASALPIVFTTATSERYRIAGDGVATWSNVGGVAGTAMTLNSTGLGVGVTPSTAWNTGGNLQIGAFAGLYTNSSLGAVDLTSNSIRTGSDTYQYLSASSNAASRFQQRDGSFRWFNAIAGTSPNAIAFTQAMTLDASGNLLVGKSSAVATAVGIQFQPLGTSYHTLSASTNADATLLVYSTGAAAYRFYVGLGGTVFATNTTISAISDARLKENVQDLDVGLAAILSLKPRKFDWKAGKGKDIKGDRGFIAQEFETVFPNLVDEWKDPAPEGEAPYKSVRQDLIPVLVKAIQELAAEVNALKNA